MTDLTDEAIDRGLREFREGKKERRRALPEPLRGWSLVHAVNRLLHGERLDAPQVQAIIDQLNRCHRL